jgi:hypothetical protein
VLADPAEDLAGLRRQSSRVEEDQQSELPSWPRGCAVRHGPHLYATDDVLPDHAGRCTLQDCPFVSELAVMDIDERSDSGPRSSQVGNHAPYKEHAIRMI